MFVRACTLVATLLAALALVASAAQASTYSDILHAYESHGSVPPCQFSSQQLESALKGVDTYGAQYFADFTAAIQSALAARGTGACAPQSAATPALGGLPARNAALPSVSVTAATDSGIPAPIALMAIVAAILAMVGAVFALARVRGWDPAWAAGWQHAWSEAGYRVGGTWAEFRDWLRASS
jgi:hypothetical protein